STCRGWAWACAWDPSDELSEIVFAMDDASGVSGVGLTRTAELGCPSGTGNGCGCCTLVISGASGKVAGILPFHTESRGTCGGDSGAMTVRSAIPPASEGSLPATDRPRLQLPAPLPLPPPPPPWQPAEEMEPATSAVE
ncbi:hypothetical protein Vretimale_6551, partial [Volvox reticuliferus]